MTKYRPISPFLCMDMTYITCLLKEGFGFKDSTVLQVSGKYEIIIKMLNFKNLQEIHYREDLKLVLNLFTTSVFVHIWTHKSKLPKA